MPSWSKIINTLSGAQMGAKMGSETLQNLSSQNRQKDVLLTAADKAQNAASNLFLDILQKLNTGDAAGARLSAKEGLEVLGRSVEPQQINMSKDSSTLDPRIGAWHFEKNNSFQYPYDHDPSLEIELDGVPMIFPISNRFGGADYHLQAAARHPASFTPQEMNRLLNNLVERYDASRALLDPRGTSAKIGELEREKDHSLVGMVPPSPGVSPSASDRLTLPYIRVSKIPTQQLPLNVASTYIMALPTNSRVSEVSVNGSQITAKIDGEDVSSTLSLAERGTIANLVQKQGLNEEKVHAIFADRVFADRLHTPSYAISPLSAKNEEVLHHSPIR